MATMYLGAEFDIHGGGIDLIFPHHENEQAQSHAAGDGFARFWLHNAWVTMAGEKMSKSLGNTLSIDALLRRSAGSSCGTTSVAPHYRSSIEFSDSALQEAVAAYRRIESFVHRVRERVGATASRAGCARSSWRRWTTTWAPPARWPPSTTPCARATPRWTRATTRPRSGRRRRCGR